MVFHNFYKMQEENHTSSNLPTDFDLSNGRLVNAGSRLIPLAQ